jgi:hypothetical protein
MLLIVHTMKAYYEILNERFLQEKSLGLMEVKKLAIGVNH